MPANISHHLELERRHLSRLPLSTVASALPCFSIPLTAHLHGSNNEANKLCVNKVATSSIPVAPPPTVRSDVSTCCGRPSTSVTLPERVVTTRLNWLVMRPNTVMYMVPAWKSAGTQCTSGCTTTHTHTSDATNATATRGATSTSPCTHRGVGAGVSAGNGDVCSVGTLAGATPCIVLAVHGTFVRQMAHLEPRVCHCMRTCERHCTTTLSHSHHVQVGKTRT